MACAYRPAVERACSAKAVCRRQQKFTTSPLRARELRRVLPVPDSAWRKRTRCSPGIRLTRQCIFVNILFDQQRQPSRRVGPDEVARGRLWAVPRR